MAINKKEQKRKKKKEKYLNFAMKLILALFMIAIGAAGWIHMSDFQNSGYLNVIYFGSLFCLHLGFMSAYFALQSYKRIKIIETTILE